MLIAFQQALAEITASPALCLAVRRDPAVLEQRYRLTPRERSQVIGVANHPSMECTCSLYRANRLAPLARNLRRWLAGQPLQVHRPQARTLNLLSCGDHTAIASWGSWSARGGWVWRWKDRIDRAFIARFGGGVHGG